MSNDTKALHRVLRRLAAWAVWSFFTEVHIIGEDNVPKDGPIIVTATHHNMMLDPAVLSSSFPYKRILNYWSKATLFANPVMSYILYSSGNIPVDRKSKDRTKLFKGTFDALATGQAVALFPEGTSYTEPRIMQVKDGAAWAALEYTKWLKDHPEVSSVDVVIVPAAIVYTNKSKYRSDVIVEFGRPISVEPFKGQFLSEVEGAPRVAAKALTKTIESRLVEATINAPDWDTLYAARMTRDLLWEPNRSINLDEFVSISQTLVDLFSTPDLTPNFASVKRRLLEYYSLLQTTHLTNSVLSSLPLSRTLDPQEPVSLPSRLATLAVLVRDSLSSLVRLPFFLFPLIVHLPVYALGRFGAKLVEDEEETQAQNKVVIGLLLLLLIYPSAFFFLWALFLYTPTGAILAAGTVWMFAVYHNKMINDNYEHAKRFIATWQVLVGVWAPKRLELSLQALSQYTTPIVPKESPWITRPKETSSGIAAVSKSDTSLAQSSAIVPEVTFNQVSEPPVSDKAVRAKNKKRPSPRKIMRHVLRARIEALRALASFFDQLEREALTDGKGPRRAKASAHLARMYGGIVEEIESGNGNGKEELGWRSVREVVAFLKARGAKIPSLGRPIEEGDWAANLSSDEGASTPAEEKDLVFVPRGQ